jgi:flavin-dependent dehydrogenase
VVQSRVTQVETCGDRVEITARNGEGRDDTFSHRAVFVVLAAGARNRLLPETTPLAPDDLEQTVGYFVPASEDTIKVKFLPGFEGYLWSFPRPDHLSVGICGKIRTPRARERKDSTAHTFKRHLERFMTEERIPPGGGRFFSHVLPSPQARTLGERRVVGRNWALVGDAAAWVDPLTGEGLYYALRSGDLLAQALANGRPEEYPQRVREEFSSDLQFAVRVARRFFRGRFLGGAVAIRMIQFVQRSPTFRALMRDLFSGAQDYRSLKRRLWAQVGVTLSEILASLLRPSAAAAVREERPTPRESA